MRRNRPTLMQVAYVVPDLEAAIEHWAMHLAVGPFFVLPHVHYAVSTYRGAPSTTDVSLAFAFSGALQIELVQQHDDAPSIFSEFLRLGVGGIQHLGAVSDMFDDDVAAMRASGYREVQHLLAASGTETRFFLHPDFPGDVVELIRGSAALHERFQAMRDAALSWDGSTARAP